MFCRSEGFTNLLTFAPLCTYDALALRTRPACAVDAVSRVSWLGCMETLLALDCTYALVANFTLPASVCDASGNTDRGRSPLASSVGMLPLCKPVSLVADVPNGFMVEWNALCRSVNSLVEKPVALPLMFCTCAI